MPLNNMTLKVGSVIMLLRNLNSKKGMCNGSRLIIRSLSPNLIHAEIISGNNNGERVFIPRINLTSKGNDLPFVLKRRQFSIRLSFVSPLTKVKDKRLKKLDCIYLIRSSHMDSSMSAFRVYLALRTLGFKSNQLNRWANLKQINFLHETLFIKKY